MIENANSRGEDNLFNNYPETVEFVFIFIPLLVSVLILLLGSISFSVYITKNSLLVVNKILFNAEEIFRDKFLDKREAKRKLNAEYCEIDAKINYSEYKEPEYKLLIRFLSIDQRFEYITSLHQMHLEWKAKHSNPKARILLTLHTFYIIRGVIGLRGKDFFRRCVESVRESMRR